MFGVGFVLSLALALQIISGLFLSSFYVPYSNLIGNSVAFTLSNLIEIWFSNNQIKLRLNALLTKVFIEIYCYSTMLLVQSSRSIFPTLYKYKLHKKWNNYFKKNSRRLPIISITCFLVFWTMVILIVICFKFVLFLCLFNLSELIANRFLTLFYHSLLFI